MPNSIAIICARGGSKGLLRKNLQSLDGEPLIARAIRHAREARCLDSIIVTTDDEEIADISRKAGAEVPFLRPSLLAEDLTTTEATLQHALITYESLVNQIFDIGVFLTTTDIFRNPSWIANAVKLLNERNDLESVFSGHKTHKNFWKKNDDGNWIRICDWMSTYSSRQVRQFVVREDTGLACASRAWLWRQGRRIGDKVEIILNDDDFTSIDIHNMDDLRLAEAAIQIRKNLK